MYEHSSYVYNTFAIEQERIDRANERRRFIAEHPERIVRRERPFVARVRAWFAVRRADAAAPAETVVGSEHARESSARAVPAR